MNERRMEEGVEGGIEKKEEPSVLSKDSPDCEERAKLGTSTWQSKKGY